MKEFLKARYHWVVAFAVLLVMFVYVGIYNNLMALYLVPVSEELSLSRGSFSLAFSGRSVVSAFTVALSGPLIRRFGYRRLTGIGLALACAAYVNLGLSRNLTMIFASFITIGICDGVCGMAAAVYLVSNWFHKYRGTMLGLVSASTGLGGSAFCVMIASVMEGAGWRTSLFVCGGIMALASLLVFLLVRNQPAQMGLRPLGEGIVTEKTAVKKLQKDHWQGFSLSQLVRRPNFYLALLAVLLTNLCLSLSYYNMVPHLQSSGISSAQAAAMQSVMLLAMAGAKLLCGMCCDLFGTKVVYAVSMGCLTVCLFLFSFISGLAGAWTAVMVFAIALPLMSTLIPLIASSLFGYQTNSAITGVFLAAPSVGAIIANPVANALYDRLGTYQPVFLAAAILSVFIILLYMVVFVLSGRDRKKLAEEKL